MIKKAVQAELTTFDLTWCKGGTINSACWHDHSRHMGSHLLPISKYVNRVILDFNHFYSESTALEMIWLIPYGHICFSVDVVRYLDQG